MPGLLTAGINNYLKGHQKPPKVASGPLSAFHMALQAAGWTFLGPLQVKAREGSVLFLHQVCPARIVKLFRADYANSISHRAMRKLNDRVDSVESRLLVSAGLFIEPLLKVHSKLLKTSKRQASTLVRIVSNGVCTRTGLSEIGFDVDPECPVCHSAVDTVMHRGYLCAPMEQDILHSYDATLIATHVGEASSFLFLTRLLAPNPTITSHPPPTPVINYHNLGGTLLFRQMTVKCMAMNHAFSLVILS